MCVTELCCIYIENDHLYIFQCSKTLIYAWLSDMFFLQGSHEVLSFVLESDRCRRIWGAPNELNCRKPKVLFLSPFIFCIAWMFSKSKSGLLNVLNSPLPLKLHFVFHRHELTGSISISSEKFILRLEIPLPPILLQCLKGTEN